MILSKKQIEKFRHDSEIEDMITLARICLEEPGSWTDCDAIPVGHLLKFLETYDWGEDDSIKR